MRAVIQRTLAARVRVQASAEGGDPLEGAAGAPHDVVTGSISRGLVAFVGAGAGDTEADAQYLARKVAKLRVFPDERGRMARTLLEEQASGGEGVGLLAVSQFTVFGDVRRGNRPGFDAAMEPGAAERFLDRFYELCRAEGLRVSTGKFRADMRVDVENDGPVTLLLDSKRAF